MQKLAKITTWGNGLGLRIPKAMATSLNLSPGVPVELLLKEDHLEVRPVRRKTLAERFADYEGPLDLEEIWPDQEEKGKEQI